MIGARSRSAQSPADGSWSYLKTKDGQRIAGTGSMTCAGIASVVISEAKLNQADARIVKGEVACCGQPSDDRAAKAVERGLQWLGRKWTVAKNPVARGKFERTPRLSLRRSPFAAPPPSSLRSPQPHWRTREAGYIAAP